MVCLARGNCPFPYCRPGDGQPELRRQAVAQSPSQELAALFAASNEGEPAAQPARAQYSAATCAMPDSSATYQRCLLRRRARRGGKPNWPRSSGSTEPSSAPSERISYDVFKWQRTSDLRGLQPDLLALTAVRPIDHFGGFHTDFAELSSGDGAAPFKTVEDYDNGLTRIDGFVPYVDGAIGRMRQGLAAG